MSLTSVTLKNATDAAVVQSRPSENYGDTTRLRLQAGAAASRSYVYFSRPFPLGAVITSATLRLYGVGSWPSATRNMTVERAATSWKATRVTWNNAPDVFTSSAVTVQKTGVLPDKTLWSFDVTAHMQLVADGATWYGWRVTTDETTLRYLHSAQSPVIKPTLSVTWTLPPSKPSTLSPSGNRSVSAAKPIVRCDFTDPVANTTLGAINVQISATNNFAAPDFDSGTVSASVPQLDLSATAYAGLADGASTYWRVRVQDASGLWSPWSDPAQMARATKGTLTITNPAVSPNNYVQEATPPLTWTLTSRTQSAYQVIIASSTGAILHTSGKITGTATAYTLPARVLHDGLTYRLYVRIWDTVTRESTPNDPAYTEAFRDFTYNLSATVTVVSALTATDLAPVPGVQLDWTRATAPDSFTIVRDGKVIAAGLLAADLLVSGTAYRYVDRTVSPRVSHTWQVRPVVNGVTAASNPSVSKTITPVGIWLSDPERSIDLQLAGTDDGSWDMGEDAAVYTPVGASAPVRITQGLRGYEGSVSGVLVARGGRTFDQAEADAWLLKSTPGQVYRLTLSNLCMPVVIGQLVIAPTPRAELDKSVSFSFWQVGDLPFEASL